LLVLARAEYSTSSIQRGFTPGQCEAFISMADSLQSAVSLDPSIVGESRVRF